jgi:transposase
MASFGSCVQVRHGATYRQAGIWDQIMEALAAGHDATVQMIDTSSTEPGYGTVARGPNEQDSRGRGHQWLLADRGYDADWIRELAREQGAWVNIPPKRNRKDPICFSPYLYRARNLVERFFNKIKQCRRVATRYDKLAANYLAFVKLASIRIWLRANESAPYMPYFVCTAPNIVELTNIGKGPLLMTVLIQSLAAAIHSIER